MHLLAPSVVRLDESHSTVQDILAGTFVDVVMVLSAALSVAFAAHPLNSAEILGPYADTAVVLQDVTEFVFAEHHAPALGSFRQNLAVRRAVGNTRPVVRPVAAPAPSPLAPLTGPI
jgi:hypothetical protein